MSTPDSHNAMHQLDEQATSAVLGLHEMLKTMERLNFKPGEKIPMLKDLKAVLNGLKRFHAKLTVMHREATTS